MSSERQIRWMAQVQRVQDLLSQCHRLSLVVLDSDCNELTVPSGLPSDCGSADPAHSSPCWRHRKEAMVSVQATRQAVRLPCPKGRWCFVSPMGVDLDEYDTPIPHFLAGSGASKSHGIQLVQEVFRLVQFTPAHVAPTPASAPEAEVSSGAASRRPPASRHDAPLTKREEDILALIGAGFSNREIAERLYISQATVKTHVTHLLQKLGLANRTEAALYAVRESIISVNPPEKKPADRRW